jgi:hypothetical protein
LHFGNFSFERFILTAQIFEPYIFLKELFKGGKQPAEQLDRRAHRFGHGALQDIHFVGSSEIEGKNIQKGTDKHEDQERTTHPAKPNARIEKSHIRHFDLEN